MIMGILNIKKSNYIFYIISFGIFSFLYYQTIHFEYVWDDAMVIARNPLLMSPKLTWSLLAQPVLPGTSYFRPLVFVSWYMERQWFGLNPAVSHIINILFFYGSVLLVFHLIQKILHHQPYAGELAALGALIFLCHPRNVEAVAWASGRFDVFATFFLLAGWYAFIQIWHKYVQIIVVMLCHLAALGSKEIGILMPIVLFCVWMLHEHRPGQPWRPVIRAFFWKNPLLILLLFIDSVAYLYIRSYYASGLTHVGVTWDFIYQNYFVLWLPAITLKEYIVRTVLPFYNMGVMLPVEFFITVSNKIISLIVCILMIGGIIYAFIRRNTIVFALIAYIVMILLVLHLIPVTISGIVQDRFLMSALPFYSLFVAYIAQQCIANFHRVKSWLAGISIYILIISLITVQLIPAWTNPLTFWMAMSSYQEEFSHEFHPMLIQAYADSRLPREEIRRRIEELIAKEKAMTRQTGVFRPEVYILYALYLINNRDPKGLIIMDEYIEIFEDIRHNPTPEKLKSIENISVLQMEEMYMGYAHGLLIMHNDIDKADIVLQKAKELRTTPPKFEVLVYDIIFDILKDRTESAKIGYQKIKSMQTNQESDIPKGIFTINKFVTQVCEAKKLSVPACQNLPFDTEKFFAGQ